MKNKIDLLLKYFIKNRIIVFTVLIYWIIIVASSTFFIVIGFHSNTHLNFYIYEASAICIFVFGIIMFKYFIGLLNYENEILLFLNLLTASFIFLSIPGAFILMAVGAQLIEKLPNFRTFGYEGDWINFIGIVITGAITLIGITYTIRNEQKLREIEFKRKEVETAIISTPVMAFELSDEFVKRPRHYRMKKTKNNLIKFSLISDFFIRNTSNNFAIIDSFKLESIEIVNNFMNERIKLKQDNIISYSFKTGDIIPPNGSITIQYDINCTIEDLNSIVLKFRLIYFDFMSQNKYFLDADFSLHVRVLNDEERDNYAIDGEEIYVPIDEFYIEVVYSKIINKYSKEIKEEV